LKVYLLLDRSGSMVSQWEGTLEAINGYVSKLAKNTKVLMAVFDTQSYDVVRDTTAKDWALLTSEEISPRGGTPLYDSTGRLINRCFEDKPKKAVLVIMTDGYENASREFNQYQIKNLIKTAQDRGYETVFLGANFDAIDGEAAKVGVGATRSVYVRPENMYTTMTNSLAAKTNSYAASASMSEGAASMDWSVAEKDDAKSLVSGNKTTSLTTSGGTTT